MNWNGIKCDDDMQWNERQQQSMSINKHEEKIKKFLFYFSAHRYVMQLCAMHMLVVAVVAAGVLVWNKSISILYV